MRADIGWWVVKGVKGEFYPVRPDIFEATYEPAGAQPQDGPVGCACGHAQTGHAFSDDVCAVPDCPCPGYRHTPRPAPELAAVTAERDSLRNLLARYERITTAWTRGMYAARIDCVRGDVKAAIECLSEGLDGYDGTEWDGTETGAAWWERTKAEEGL